MSVREQLRTVEAPLVTPSSGLSPIVELLYTR
jgi:hypothetical protein